MHRWLDGVYKAHIARSLELKDAKVRCRDRNQWRSVVNDTSGGVNR